MNRFAAPILLALAVTFSGAAVAAPLSTAADVTKFFETQNQNGN